MKPFLYLNRLIANEAFANSIEVKEHLFLYTDPFFESSLFLQELNVCCLIWLNLRRVSFDFNSLDSDRR